MSRHMKHFRILLSLLVGTLLVIGTAQSTMAAEESKKKHKIVIQVSTDDPKTQKIALAESGESFGTWALFDD